jgi:hypothetical protein
MSAEYRERIEDRESWLSSVTDDPESKAQRPSLLATAAVLRGVVRAIDVPEGAEERSRQRALAAWEARSQQQAPHAARATGWPQTLTGLLRVVFTFGRRR